MLGGSGRSCSAGPGETTLGPRGSDGSPRALGPKNTNGTRSGRRGFSLLGGARFFVSLADRLHEDALSDSGVVLDGEDFPVDLDDAKHTGKTHHDDLVPDPNHGSPEIDA